ncbi:hypothetical protein BJ878DRAFT_528877 [Calycina marina]|uniref:Uncharacterized protein n=1 Tax=Calycina marina TaxID=1763456 RepID=A0A9P7YUM8_9HELO|nr:hypothetical protein BJ878DRAFT_528877 [Calycina marina]
MHQDYAFSLPLSSSLYTCLLCVALCGLVLIGLVISKRLHVLPTTRSSPSLSYGKAVTSPAYRPDVYRPDTLLPGLSICDCGKTIEEAQRRECKYDALATAWLPSYCRDDELTAEFGRAGPGRHGAWSYFADEAGKLALNKTEIAILGESGGSFWASRRWHIVHCLFYWQKHTRMRQTGLVMEERFDSIHHVKHCSRLILNPEPDHFFMIEV